MAVSKHNLWKRQKNGLMKLVRSHSDWLERRRERKNRVINHEAPIVDNSTQTKPGKMAKNIMSGGTKSSTKRTQIGKKI